MRTVKAGNSQFSGDKSSGLLDPGILLPAFCAMLVVQIFRAEHHRWLPVLWLESAVFIALPFLGMLLIGRKISLNSNEIGSTKNLYLAQIGVVLICLLVFGWQWVSRLIGLGDSNEVVALLMLQSVSWYMAVFSGIRGFEKTSLMLSGAIVTFVCFLTMDLGVFVVAGVFALSSVWWMLGFYWSRLEDKAIDGSAKVLAIHGTSTIITAIVIAVAVGLFLLSPYSPKTISVAGFMPFSGGKSGGGDEFARNGIGDGQMLTGGNNATSTGPVESDSFIEDDKPSLYDVLTEKYDGPVFKKNQVRRSVPLSEIAKHLHGVNESEKAGRKFRTIRESDKVQEMDLKEEKSDALIMLEGQVPIRFTLNTFQQFDGWDWEEIPPSDTDFVPGFKMEEVDGKPIFSTKRIRPNYLKDSRHYNIKFLRLDANVIPSPPFLNRWHIAKVTNPDLFRWKDGGVLQLKGDAPIPTHTIVDVECLEPDYKILRASEYTRPRSQSKLLHIPDTSAAKKINELAAKWTEGIPPGWQQVESIVDHMRNDFELTPMWTIDDTVDDSVSHFLAQRGGPSYMFATTCCMVLRAAGYKTRLANGFLVLKDDFDPTLQLSLVTTENFHFWPEIRLKGSQWIPVEPTPNLPKPFDSTSFVDWMATVCFAVFLWLYQNPLVPALAVTTIVILVLVRDRLLNLAMMCWWYLVRIFRPQSLPTTTRQLIDFRFWISGATRPRSATIFNWYSQVESGLATDFVELWNARNFCNERPSTSRSDVINCCREQMQRLTLRKIREQLVADKGTQSK